MQLVSTNKLKGKKEGIGWERKGRLKSEGLRKKKRVMGRETCLTPLKGGKRLELISS